MEGTSHIPNSDRIFHWCCCGELPKAATDSPKELERRKYKYFCTRFASEKVRDLAVMHLDLSTLADVAMACLDETMSSTGYWWELLSLRVLQV